VGVGEQEHIAQLVEFLRREMRLDTFDCLGDTAGHLDSVLENLRNPGLFDPHIRLDWRPCRLGQYIGKKVVNPAERHAECVLRVHHKAAGSGSRLVGPIAGRAEIWKICELPTLSRGKNF
jgi:hypothetical protein